MKVIQAFLYCTHSSVYIGLVVEYLNKINMLQSTTRSLRQAPDIQNYSYAYSMKSLNNFQNAPGSDFNFFHIKVLLFCILAKVSINSKDIKKMPLILSQENNHLFGIT